MSTSNTIQGLPFVVRHIRKYDEESFTPQLSAFGGLTFSFLIDNEAKTLSFSFGLCRPNERFVKKIAYSMLHGRAVKKPEQMFVMSGYNREFSLVENAVSALRELVYPGDMKGMWPYLNVEAKLIQLPNEVNQAALRKAVDSVLEDYEGPFPENLPDESLNSLITT